MTINKNAPDAGQGIEGSVTTTEGRDMTNPTPTLAPAEEDALIRAWARDYEASWAAMIADAQQEDTWEAMVRAGVDYGNICTAHERITQWRAPAVPRELWPAWAVDVEVVQGGAREVHVTFTGTTHGDTACLERYYNVMVLPGPAPEALGTWECEGTKVWAEPLSNDLTPDAARALAAALTAAANELDAHA